MRKVNLTIPKSYAHCSLAQLRAITNILIDGTQRATSLRPFDMVQFKVSVFFRLTGLVVIGFVKGEKEDNDYYLCRFNSCSIENESHFLKRNVAQLKAWFYRNILKNDDTFPLYIWQINDFIFPRKDEKGKIVKEGVLDWLDDDKKSNLLIFPFASVKRNGVVFNGPNPLMDGFTWQRYRFAQDFMQSYIDIQNVVLKKRESSHRMPLKEQYALAEQVDKAQAAFLSIIFERKVKYLDPDSGLQRYDFHFQPDQYASCQKYFRHFPMADWQIVLIWWQSMMYYLQKTYPHVFKKQKLKGKKKKAPTNPLELYTRTTATIEKYLGVTAKDVDNEPYTTVLQQLEDIVVQNEEMDKINKKR